MDALPQAEDVGEAVGREMKRRPCQRCGPWVISPLGRHSRDHGEHGPPFEPVHAYPAAAHAAAPDLARRDDEVAEHLGERGEDVGEDDVAKERGLAGRREEDALE